MIRRLIGLGAIASLTACSLAPPYARPEAPVSPSWPVGDAYLRSSEAALPAVRYQDIFRDPRLQAIIARENSGSSQTRFAIAARWIPCRMISASLMPRRLAASLMIARSSGSA